MKKYDKYKNSFIPWITAIPDHWDEKSLIQFAEEQQIKNTGMQEKNLLSLSYGRIVKKDINTTDGLLPASFEGYQIVHNGNIILRLTDLQNDHKSLRTGLVTQTGIITSAYTCIKTRSEVLPGFLQLALHVADIRKVFYSLGGGVRQSIGFKDIRYLPIAVPPRDEQDQIVRFLDWKVSTVNKLINAKRQEIKSLVELKRSMVSSVVTRGLSQNVPMKNSGVKWLGDIPAHWEIVKLRKLLHPVSEKNHPELPLLSVVREQGVVVRDVEDKDANHNYIPDDLSGYKVVRKGQFAMNKMKAWQGSYGVSDYTGIVSPAYFIFDVSFDNLEYFHYAIRSKVYVNFFAQASDGIRVGQWDLQMDKMKEIPFFVPPANEQNAIVDYIRTTLPKYDVAIEKLQMGINALEEYKTKLIADVVTGKIDVRDVEIPAYELVDEDVDMGEADEDFEQDGSGDNEE